MLHSLRIRNFRLFEDLTLPKLGRVNLVVGRNHSGKSCLLEAVHVYEERGAESVLRKLVGERREDVEALLSLSGQVSESPYQAAMNDPLRHLFHGRRFPLNEDGFVTIGQGDGYGHRNLYLGAHAVRRTRDPGTHRAGDTLEETVGNAERLLRDDELWFGPIAYIVEVTVIQYDEEGPEVSVHFGLGGERPYWHSRPGEPRNVVRHIGASGWSDDDVARHWAPISVRPSLKRAVRDALRLIEPGIEEIVMVPGRKGAPPEPIAVYSDELQVPLRALGEGIGRLFRIAMAMVAVKGGTVLIDEFENGLHWEIQPKAWELVYKLAAELDVQVFATSHSLDCVRAFQQADAAFPEVTGMLHRLGRSVRRSDEGAIVARSYEGEALAMAVSAGLEVR